MKSMAALFFPFSNIGMLGRMIRLKHIMRFRNRSTTPSCLSGRLIVGSVTKLVLAIRGTHQPKVINIKCPTPISLSLCLDDLYFDEEIKEHDVANQWKQRDLKDAHKPFHPKIDDYHSAITMQSL